VRPRQQNDDDDDDGSMYLAVEVELVEVTGGDVGHGQLVDGEAHILLSAFHLHVVPLSIVQQAPNLDRHVPARVRRRP